VVVPHISALTLLTGGAGFACWIVAQSLMLGSRHPVAPLILFTVGYALLHPLLIATERRWLSQSDQPPVLQTNLPAVLPLIRQHRREVAALIALTTLAALIQITTPSPFNIRPLYGGVWAVLLVPAVFWLGYVYHGTAVGLIAAGFAAVSGWALVLGRADPVYPALALLFALYLIAIEYGWRERAAIPLVTLPILGLLTSPLFIYPMLLLPVREGLFRIDEKRSWRRVLVQVIVGVLVAGAFIVPRLATTPSITQSPNVANNPQYTFGEAFFNSVLMFNLTGDPNPLHGFVNRPALSPVTAAAFLLGLIGLAWKINARRQWLDSFPLWALVVALLPSALLLSPPVRYPDVQQAAMALPVALVIAAFGVALLLRLLVERLGKIGVVLAVVIVVAALALAFTDARLHYVNIFIPAYENTTLSPW
jgi:hypothetical protein